MRVKLGGSFLAGHTSYTPQQWTQAIGEKFQPMRATDEVAEPGWANKQLRDEGQMGFAFSFNVTRTFEYPGEAEEWIVQLGAGLVHPFHGDLECGHDEDDGSIVWHECPDAAAKITTPPAHQGSCELTYGYTIYGGVFGTQPTLEEPTSPPPPTTGPPDTIVPTTVPPTTVPPTTVPPTTVPPTTVPPATVPPTTTPPTTVPPTTTPPTTEPPITTTPPP